MVKLPDYLVISTIKAPAHPAAILSHYTDFHTFLPTGTDSAAAM